MFKPTSFWMGALFSFAATGAKRVALILAVALFFWVTSTVVESLLAPQILAPLTWAQSETLAGEEGAVKEEGESATPKELEDESGEEEEVAQPQEMPDEEVEEEEQIEENIVDRIHGALSGYVSAAADKVDGFYDDERFADEVNTTRIKLRVDYFLEKGEDPKLKFRFNLNLALPRINKRLKLLVSGKPDEEETDETGAGLGEEGEEDNVEVALAYAPVETTEHNLSLRAGLRFKNITPAFWVGPRWRAYSQGEIWGTRLTNSFRWYTDTGFRIDTTLDFERPITENFFYRQSAKGTWDEDKDRYDYDVIFAVFQRLARKRSLKYEYRSKFRSTNDHQLDNIIFSVTYRQNIWRRWLFFEIAPQVSFPESEGWDFTPGILFRIETIIGKEELKKKKRNDK
ncbi:MAG: hypothetical protein JSV14_14630 [Deltaproteobacteria bacterium]|nr:MAG: hypothetical protein JSV14_14630 [Deltaproteobacteria bacterium]